jgi:hypothetical protein
MLNQQLSTPNRPTNRMTPPKIVRKGYNIVREIPNGLLALLAMADMNPRKRKLEFTDDRQVKRLCM